MGKSVDLQKLQQAVTEWFQSEPGTQKALAEKAGVSQSTVSNLLRGKRLSDAVTVKLAKAVGLPAEEIGGPAGPSFAYCGSPDCPSVCLATVGGKLYAAPEFRRITKSTAEDCPYCDSLLYQECPNCCSPISAKALFCPKCKEPYVPVPDDLEGLRPRDLIRECLRRNRINEQLCRRLADEP